MKTCPYCHAELHDEATFCLYCMRSLEEKQKVETPKRRIRKRIKILICAIVAAAIVIGSVCAVLLSGKPKICDYDNFYDAVQLVSERFECGELWDVSELKDVQSSPSGEWILYSAPLNVENADFSVSFYKGGEEILAVLENFTDDNFDSAIKLAVCVTDAVYNNYLSDIEEFFEGNRFITFTDCDYAYHNYITEAIGLPDTLPDEEKNGAVITSKFKTSELENTEWQMRYELRTKDYGNKNLYDLTLYFYQEGEE